MPDPAQTHKQLDLIRVVALVDFFLLVALVAASLSDSGAVSILGPIHGLIFLGLVYLVVKGAGEGRWGWWFVITTPVPIFALVGEYKIRRDLPAPAA